MGSCIFPSLGNAIMIDDTKSDVQWKARRVALVAALAENEQLRYELG